MLLYFLKMFLFPNKRPVSNSSESQPETPKKKKRDNDPEKDKILRMMEDTVLCFDQIIR